MSQELLDVIAAKVNQTIGQEVLYKMPPQEADEEAETLKPTALLNFGKPMIILDSKYWTINIAKMLHDDPELDFHFLTCVTGVDYKDHMEVIYNLYNTNKKLYLYVKVNTTHDNPVIASVESIWKSADYMEREVYDMFGINFSGHWNMKRILLEDDWEGYPMRKDYITDKAALGLV